MKKQEGGVSIVVVMFAAILFVALTVGFTVLMLRDQNRATDSDLAQSAYDSAQAGVADAKRLYNTYLQCKLKSSGVVITTKSGSHQVDCGSVISAIEYENQECNTVGQFVGGSEKNKETIIKQNSGDEQLQQAYTCVKIQPKTPDVEKIIRNEGDIKIIPLLSEGSVGPARGSDFYKVEVLWSQVGDGSNEVSGVNSREMEARLGDKKNKNTTTQLPKSSAWKPEFGSVLRVQTISYNPGEGNLKTQDIDNQIRSVFLYPSADEGGDVLDYTSDSSTKPINLSYEDIDGAGPVDKHTPLPENNSDIVDASNLDSEFNKPKEIRCYANPNDKNKSSHDQYHCKAEIYVKPNDNGNITYLTLAGMYIPSGGLNVSVKMIKKDKDDNTKDVIAMFNGVQPIVDSTGRANNLFRRISSRVDTPMTDENAMPLPRAALGVRGDLCKSFIIGDSANDFSSNKSDICSDIDLTKNPDK